MSLAVIVLTYNESLHIDRCLACVKRFADQVLVVDSYSTDDTVDRARSYNVHLMQNKWTNHATQMNWAIENGGITTDWVMRIDADEHVSEAFISAISAKLGSASQDIGGFAIDRRILFMGQEIRHGGMSPMWITRVWRHGWAYCEDRWMDEHMVLKHGNVGRLKGTLIDQNLNTLTWWTQKHNIYANREAAESLAHFYGLRRQDDGTQVMDGQTRVKRWLKDTVYSRLPLGIRPWLYFLYRLVFRLGLLDGARGIIFHTLQGLWYRLLVDSKIRETRDEIERNGVAPQAAIEQVLGVSINIAARAEESYPGLDQ